MDQLQSVKTMESVPETLEDQKFTIHDGMIMLHDVVYILCGVALVFMFFFRLVTVDGDSMYPTLCNQDQVIMLSGMWYGQPEPGDVVVVRAPEFSPDPLIKRIVAVEGDTVDIDFVSGEIRVNGIILDEEYIPEPTFRDFEDGGMDYPLQIEKGCVFLLGDNRNVSFDSRFALIGQVDARNILGKVVFLAFPGRDHVSGIREFGRIGVMEQEGMS